MHAKYVSTTAATIAQIIADFAALATGASIASLSASCDKVNSTLISTVAPGWTLVDAAAAGSGQVVSAPDANGLTTKYVRLFAATASTIDLGGYEAWNATTHVGTNVTNPTAVTLAFTAGAVNTYWMFATPRSCYIVNGTTGIGALEISRDAVFLAGSTYPCLVSVSTASLVNGVASAMAMPRTKKTAATGDNTGATASSTISVCSLGGRTSASPIGTATVTLRDGAETAYYEVRPMWVGITADGMTVSRPAILGKLYDALEIASAAGAIFDTFSDGTDTYMLVSNPGNCVVAFKVA